MAEPKYTIEQKARIYSSRYGGKAYEVTYDLGIERFTRYAKAGGVYEVAMTEGLTPQEWSEAIAAEDEQRKQAVIDAADNAAWKRYAKTVIATPEVHAAFMAGRMAMREETRRYA
jgi:hypothetical protein